jgi:hypothetical protein
VARVARFLAEGAGRAGRAGPLFPPVEEASAHRTRGRTRPRTAPASGRGSETGWCGGRMREKTSGRKAPFQSRPHLDGGKVVAAAAAAATMRGRGRM